jgi:LPS O-antigen subunit length determinant protein (WzzB/FepE family)
VAHREEEVAQEVAQVQDELKEAQSSAAAQFDAQMERLEKDLQCAQTH